MLEVLKLIVFSLLSLRYFYWIASILEKNEFSLKIFISECVEMGFLLFILTQYLRGAILPMHMSLAVSLFGLGVVCLGVFLSFAGKKQLGKFWTPAAMQKVIKRQPLITSGVYTYVRHPIYAGIIFSYIGAEIVAGSWLWISFLCLLFPIYFQARKEEKLLLFHFGKKYQEYMNHTKMLIPFVL